MQALFFLYCVYVCQANDSSPLLLKNNSLATEKPHTSMGPLLKVICLLSCQHW